MTVSTIGDDSRMPLVACWTVSQKDVWLSSQRPVRAQWIDVTAPVGPHDHAYHEICLVVHGTMLHQTAAAETRIGAGHTMIVPPTAVHSLIPIDDVQVVNVYYLAEWLAMDLARLWAEPNLVPLFLSQSILRPKSDGVIIEFDLTTQELAAITSDLRDFDSERLAGKDLV